jgi:inner membrane protein
MTARTHDAFAFASLVTVATFSPPASLNLYTLFSAIIGNVVGSLIPDMDQAGNKLWDLLPIGDTLGKIFRKVFYKHRTVTHSILGVYLIYRILDWLLIKILNPAFVNPKIVLISIMVGYVSHLLADSFTEEGIPLLFPFKFNFGIPPIKKWRIVTGGWFEKFVVFPGIFVYLVWFIGRYRDVLVEIIRLVSA